MKKNEVIAAIRTTTPPADFKEFLDANMDDIAEVACKYPFKEAVDAIVAAAKNAGIIEDHISEIAQVAFDAAYETAEDAALMYSLELAAKAGIDLQDEDKCGAFLEAVQEELSDYALEPCSRLEWPV